MIFTRAFPSSSGHTAVQLIAKRSLDLCVSCAAFLVALPLLLAIAFAIRRDSPGPVLFRQLREGYRRRNFTILKFRTMSDRQHGTFEQARLHDPRVTRTGAYLRAASFDELPQIFNVIRGEMSLVGPRPHVPELSARHAPHIEGYYDRLDVRPGITGLAQVSGLRGETETRQKMAARIRCDCDYVKSWSIFGDIRICLKTAFIPLGHDGAY